MANAYKALKEDFVSNHSGGSISEINLVTAVAPAAYLLWAVLQSRHGVFETNTPLVSLLDFFINVGGLIQAVTIYSSMPSVLLGLFVAHAVVILGLSSGKKPVLRSAPSIKSDGKTTDLADHPRRPFLTAYRGGMLVVTSIAILAVDFKVFPRRFAKVETWGTSLMDVGVGSFVFAAGLASSKAFSVARIAGSGHSRGFLQQAVQSIKQTLPLLILGGARLISVKNLEYQEHVSEYGVHWNFFFTLAAIPFVMLFLQPVIVAIPGLSHGYFGMMIVVVYEIALQTTSLKAWILTAPRIDLLSQNKEGLFSWIGYLAIFLLGIETGSIVLPRHIPQSGLLSRIMRSVGFTTKGESSRAILLGSLGLLSLTYSLLLVPFYTPRLFPWLSIPISRRLANAPYVLWIGAYNTGQILMFAIVETLLFPSVHRATSAIAEKQATEKATPMVLDDYNAGGLLVFLLANLGTGVVNLSIDTLKVGSVQAIAILFTYMGILTLLARLTRGIKIKL